MIKFPKKTSENDGTFQVKKTSRTGSEMADSVD